MNGKLSFIVMAEEGHFLAHSPQPMQPASHAAMTSFPLQWEEHAT